MSRIDEAMSKAGGQGAQPLLGSGERLDVYPAESRDGGSNGSAARADEPDVKVVPHSQEEPVVSPERFVTEPRPVEFRVGAMEAQEKVVVSSVGDPLLVEQFRRMAATLHQLQLDQGTRIVMVASALAGEGKTLTSLNLALTLSESYRRRVLLVDADLRRPALHSLLHVANASGLTDTLHHDHNGAHATIFEVGARLALLPAGRPSADPMSLVTSGRMRNLLAAARDQFDWVVVDTPPVLMMPDTHLLSAMVDVAVVVAEAGRTPAPLVAKAIEMIGRERVAGVVLNRTEPREVAATFGYRYSSDYADRYPKSPVA
jgi:capsular exopolysaccharide synthesis family protein